jgi:2,5-furandicarboxylate decarboxylase 1
MEASPGVFVIPDARGHEYVRAGNNGVVSKLGIDAIVPLEKARFARASLKSVEIKESEWLK